MRRLLFTVLALLILAGAAGAIFLGIWDTPPPSTTQEHVIPNDRFIH
ncbi:MAG: hypothetical protein R3E60_04215 [Alphaproteobacteria bacterium]